jgi:hypothetical protein
MKRLVVVIKNSEGYERAVVFGPRSTLTDLQATRGPTIGVQDIVRVELQDEAEEPKRCG